VPAIFFLLCKPAISCSAAVTAPRQSSLWPSSSSQDENGDQPASTDGELGGFVFDVLEYPRLKVGHWGRKRSMRGQFRLHNGRCLSQRRFAFA